MYTLGKKNVFIDTTYLATMQDPFRYSYPPLPDDDFQTPICDNGPIVSEDEAESKEGEPEGKDGLESSFNSTEVAVKPKKVHCLPGLFLIIISPFRKHMSSLFNLYNINQNCSLCVFVRLHKVYQGLLL